MALSKRPLFVLIALALLLAAMVAPASAQEEPQRLILATTTSTEDSGLLDYILPDFEATYHAKVDVIAVGTGQAIALGETGDADVLLVHARAKEDAFVAAGHGLIRYDVMYNDFVMLGPEADPAGIRGMTSATEAFAAIAESGSAFVSRGDDSGTHTKELSIWKAAGIEEPSGDWYISSGLGMGEVLTMADEMQAYTLSDRATFAARAAGLDLVVLVEGDPALFNPYSVIPLNPATHPTVNAELGQAFAHWITSLPTQDLIASFEVGGTQLFVPDSVPYRAAHRQ